MNVKKKYFIGLGIVLICVLLVIPLYRWKQITPYIDDLKGNGWEISGIHSIDIKSNWDPNGYFPDQYVESNIKGGFDIESYINEVSVFQVIEEQEIQVFLHPVDQLKTQGIESICGEYLIYKGQVRAGIIRVKLWEDPIRYHLFPVTATIDDIRASLRL